VLYDVINLVIIDAGVDFNGRPIKTYAYNTTGQVKGFKGKYIANTQIAEGMKSPTSITADAPWGSVDVDGNTVNSTFRDKVRAAARDWGNTIVGTFGQPRYKANFTMKGTTSYAKGNLHTIAIDGVFRDQTDVIVDTINLRLTEIEHSFTRKGWITTLQFIQDESTITGTAV